MRRPPRENPGGLRRFRHIGLFPRAGDVYSSLVRGNESLKLGGLCRYRLGALGMDLRIRHEWCGFSSIASGLNLDMTGNGRRVSIAMI
jgi:hypothetical protein